MVLRRVRYINFTFFDISLFYIYLCLVISRIINLPELFKAFLALPIFFLLPLMIGMLLIECFKKISRRELGLITSPNLVSYYILSLLTGIFFLESAAVILQLLHIDLLLKNFGYLSLAIVTLGFAYVRFLKCVNIYHEWFKPYFKKHILPVFLLASFSTVPFLIKLSFVQPPFTTWFSYSLPIAHVQAVLRLLNQGFFDITQRLMEILLTSISCQLSNILYPEFFSYSGTLLVTAMLAFGTYSLAYRLSSKVSISLLSGIISIFLNAPIGLHEIPAYHFKSNTLLICLYPWVFLLVIDFLEIQVQNKLRNIMAIVTSTSIVFGILIFLTGSTATDILYSHGLTYEIQKIIIRPISIIILPLAFLLYALIKGRSISLAFIIICISALYTTNEADFVVYFSSIILFIFTFYICNKERGHIVIRVLSLSFLIIVYLAWIGTIVLPDISISSIIGYEVPNLGISNFLIKKALFSDGNSTITRYFLVLGLASLIFSKERKHVLALGALIITLFLFFLPEYWTNRGLGATTPFIAFAISNFLDAILIMINCLFTYRKKAVVIIKCIFLFLFISTLMFNLSTPIYIKFSRFPGSRLSSYEYKTTVWLKENTKETEAIISDYWTMMLLNSLSNKIWLTDRQFRAEVLDPEYKYLLENLRNYVFKASTSLEAYEKFLSLIIEMKNGIDWVEKYYCEYTGIDINSLSFIIVISPRTITWLENGEMDVMMPQYSDVEPHYLEVFNNTRYFELLFFIPKEIYVFKVKQ